MSFILKGLVDDKSAKQNKLVIFDIDDTLVYTQTKVHVIKDGQIVTSLNSHDFTHYKLKPGESFDFGDFRNAREFFDNSKPNIPMMNQLKRDINTGNKVVMVTARADFDDKELFLDTFRKFGVDINKVHVYRAGNSNQGTTEERKKLIIKKLLNNGNYDKAIMYDDAKPNLHTFMELKKEHPETRFYAWHVSLDGNATEYMREQTEYQGVGKALVSEDDVSTGMEWEEKLMDAWAPYAAKHMAKVVKQAFNSLYPDVKLKVWAEAEGVSATTDLTSDDVKADVFGQYGKKDWECNFFCGPLYNEADDRKYLELMVDDAASGSYPGVWKIIVNEWKKWATSQLKKTGADDVCFSVNEDMSGGAWGKIARAVGVKFIAHDLDEGVAEALNYDREPLYHATLKAFEPSIIKSGLLPGGNLRMFDWSDKKYVYLSNYPDIARDFVDPGVIEPSQEHEDQIFKLMKQGGVIFKIDQNKLDRKLLMSDPHFQSDADDGAETYVYSGIIPPSAIIGKEYFRIDESVGVEMVLDKVHGMNESNRLYKYHQKLRKQAGLPDPQEYLRIQKQKLIELILLNDPNQELNVLELATIPELEEIYQMVKKVDEDNTYQFAAEKTPVISPYAGVKDSQFRGAIGEGIRQMFEEPNHNPTDAGYQEGGWRVMNKDGMNEDLRKWFKEKWVRFGPDGKIRGACARGDDSEGKPKCLPQSKAHSLGKKGRASAASRKRREDPNPERSGKAINVATKKKKSNEGSNMYEASDISGLLAASHLNKSFIVTAITAEGQKKKFRVKAQNERVAKEKFLKHHTMAKILDIKEENMQEMQGSSNVTDLNIKQLATISDEALDKAYGYGRSTPGNSFGWQANLMSAAYAKKMIDAGITDIEKIADAIHKGWNVTAQKFVQNPDQFDDTEKLRQAGKLDAKLQQRAKLMKINYSQLDNDEQEKDRVVARALLKAIKGQQNVTEEKCPHCSGPMFEMSLMNEKKDACYYKVKSRYKVWPSAYASGALVKCRKKGAKNWGTKSESSIMKGLQSEGQIYSTGGGAGQAQRYYTPKDNLGEEQLDELKCWPGYKRKKGVKAGAPGSCKKA